MAERSSLNQIAQIGVEVTPGTPVPATKRLQSITIEPSIKTNIDKFTPIGQKYAAVTSQIKEWVEGPISGRLTYSEFIYMLSGTVGTGTTSTVVGGTLSKKWTFSSNALVTDVPTIYTIEHGASGSATSNGQVTYTLIPEIDIDFSRDNAPEIKGNILGQHYTKNFGTMATTTTVELIPVQSTELTVYMDDVISTVTTNSTTVKVARFISGSFHLASRFAGVYVVDAANPGYVAHVETPPDLTMTIVVEADTFGLNLVDKMRTSSTKYLRLRGITSYFIETTIPYEFTLDMALKVSDIGAFADHNGVYGIEFTFVGVFDPVWGNTFVFNLTNKIAAL